MFVSELTIKNFRCFRDITLSFMDGMNVLIGENNSGKTTILKALEVIFGHAGAERLDADDFYRGTQVGKSLQR